MSFLKKLASSSSPLNPEKSNPISAASDEKNRGGNTKSIITAALDPGELLGDNRTLTPKETAAARVDSKAQYEKEKKKRRGYAKGGKTTCRGMGSATSGGRFRKDG